VKQKNLAPDKKATGPFAVELITVTVKIDVYIRDMDDPDKTEELKKQWGYTWTNKDIQTDASKEVGRSDSGKVGKFTKIPGYDDLGLSSK